MNQNPSNLHGPWETLKMKISCSIMMRLSRENFLWVLFYRGMILLWCFRLVVNTIAIAIGSIGMVAPISTTFAQSAYQLIESIYVHKLSLETVKTYILLEYLPTFAMYWINQADFIKATKLLELASAHYDLLKSTSNNSTVPLYLAYRCSRIWRTEMTDEKRLFLINLDTMVITAWQLVCDYSFFNNPSATQTSRVEEINQIVTYFTQLDLLLANQLPPSPSTPLFYASRALLKYRLNQTFTDDLQYCLNSVFKSSGSQILNTITVSMGILLSLLCQRTDLVNQFLALSGRWSDNVSTLLMQTRKGIFVVERERSFLTESKYFQDALPHIDTLTEDTYKDSTVVLQLIRDNVSLWDTRDEKDLEDMDNEEESEEVEQKAIPQNGNKQSAGIQKLMTENLSAPNSERVQ